MIDTKFKHEYLKGVYLIPGTPIEQVHSVEAYRALVAALDNYQARIERLETLVANLEIIVDKQSRRLTEAGLA